MSLFAISDLHLSFNVNKPMDIFGDKWLNHEEQIKNNWLELISPEDTVLIAGDISWGIKPVESKEDLDWVDMLPGRKIISKGNHDYWWGSINKLNSMYQTTKFLQNNYYSYNEYAICGTRGWILPESDKFTDRDMKIYNREKIRLKLSLESAKNDGYTKFIVMIHYPPITENALDSDFAEIIKEYNVERVIYGHLHGLSENSALEGIIDGVEYTLTSSDYIKFIPKLIIK